MKFKKRQLRLISAAAAILLSGCTKNEPPEDGDSGEELNKTLFAAGVRTDKGWKDTDKRGLPEDIMACWLITASNMIEWWQDLYTGSGHVLPEGTPYGKGEGPYGSAVFDTAIRSFSALERGGNISTGLAWYIEGTEAISISDNHSQPFPGTGRFLRSIPAESREYSKRPYLDYSAWENADSETDALAVFSKFLARILETGAVLGMDIKTHVGQGGTLHAITLWGAEFDATGTAIRLYVTDSDDHEHRLVETPIRPDTDICKSRVITMELSPSDAYPDGATWEILRLFYLQGPDMDASGRSPQHHL